MLNAARRLPAEGGKFRERLGSDGEASTQRFSRLRLGLTSQSDSRAAL